MLAPKTFHPDIRSSFVVVVLKMSKMTFFSELPFADSKLGFCDLVLGFPSIFSANPLQCLGSKKLARRPEISCSIFLVELSVMYSMSWYHKLKKHIFAMAEVFNVFLCFFVLAFNLRFCSACGCASETRLLQLNFSLSRSPLMNLGFALRTRNSSQFPTFLNARHV